MWQKMLQVGSGGGEPTSNEFLIYSNSERFYQLDIASNTGCDISFDSNGLKFYRPLNTSGVSTITMFDGIPFSEYNYLNVTIAQDSWILGQWPNDGRWEVCTDNAFTDIYLEIMNRTYSGKLDISQITTDGTLYFRLGGFGNGGCTVERMWLSKS